MRGHNQRQAASVATNHKVPRVGAMVVARRSADPDGARARSLRAGPDVPAGSHRSTQMSGSALGSGRTPRSRHHK